MNRFAREHPFDYCHPTVAEMQPLIGDKWVVGRNTNRLREKYPNSNIISPAKFEEAEQKAIEARGYARLAEKAILDLIDLIKYHWSPQTETFETAPAVINARKILAKARIP